MNAIVSQEGQNTVMFSLEIWEMYARIHLAANKRKPDKPI